VNLRPLLPLADGAAVALHDVCATRAIEAQALQTHPGGVLMQRAGLRVAQLARALHPHAQRLLVVCGPGNNGGDGLVAATALHQALRPSGTAVGVLFSHGPPRRGDAAAAWTQAQAAGVVVHENWPDGVDVAIDALLGIGARAPLDPTTHGLLEALNRVPTVLCVDLPTGLDADHGTWQGPALRPEQQRHTLSLLTLKPGLFTAAGRDAAGRVWWDDLGSGELAKDSGAACARLIGTGASTPSPHNSHKGAHGEVTVIGGQLPQVGRTGMLGAAALAARAALHHGAGRVYVCPLGDSPPHWDPQQPDLMWRDWGQVEAQAPHPQHVWLAGCGGGEAVSARLARLLRHDGPLVLDADALNALAAQRDPSHFRRQRQGRLSVLTPHPLEAARLLGCTTAEVQAQRLDSAQRLADAHEAIVVLKGSGSVIAAPDLLPIINSTGNGRLGIAGTGDVLAGMLAARCARQALGPDLEAAQWAIAGGVAQHGALADHWPQGQPLTAAALAGATEAWRA
jgi:hydroxyethylthiazole kinase-like uncharacterized protein yjeF